MIGIIGGSGFSSAMPLEAADEVQVETPYGPIAVTVGTLAGRRTAFVLRHGAGHSLPPHRVNYRGNVWALRACGVTDIVAITTVGGISESMAPGAISLPNQIIDMTSGRPNTFFDGGASGVRHVDMTEPMTPALRKRLLSLAQDCGVDLCPAGIYVCTQGPRLETAAEVRFFGMLGGTMVGMTAMPEAALARELDLGYALLAVSVNWAAGIAASRAAVSLKDSDAVMARAMESITALIRGAVAREAA